MIRTLIVVGALSLTACSGLVAQETELPSSQFSSSLIGSPEPGGNLQASPAMRTSQSQGGAFSKISVGVGVSPLGIGMEVATNITDHFNVRGVGNLFKYTANFDTNGFTNNGKLDLASAGVMVDVYPFRCGFRLSPGVLFLNNNAITGSSLVAAGHSFTLDNTTYYSANNNAITGASPVTGSGALHLNETKPAFVVTTGWGNHVQRNGHWSVPVEVGVAFVGKPQVTMNLGGWACLDAAQTQCANLAGDNPIAQEIQSNLTTQEIKWTSDLEQLKTYPIVSVGLAYSFRIR